MSEDFTKPDFVKDKPDHVCYAYWLALHLEISFYQRQFRLALEAYRVKKSEDLKINKVPATIEDVFWAVDVFSQSLQTKHIEKNLFEKTDHEIRVAIRAVEELFEKVGERLKGVKAPERSPEVDAWMKKIRNKTE